MKIFIKLLIVIGLAIGLGRIILTQTELGREYYDQQLQSDLNMVRSQIIVRLGGTPPSQGEIDTNTLTGSDESLTIGYPQYDTGGNLIVTPQILEQRLQYYRDSKDALRQE